MQRTKKDSVHKCDKDLRKYLAKDIPDFSRMTLLWWNCVPQFHAWNSEAIVIILRGEAADIGTPYTHTEWE